MRFILILLFLFAISLNAQNVDVAQKLHDSGELSSEEYIRVLENNLKLEIDTDSELALYVYDKLKTKNGYDVAAQSTILPIIEQIIKIIKPKMLLETVGKNVSYWLNPSCKDQDKRDLELGRQVRQKALKLFLDEFEIDIDNGSSDDK